MRIEAIILVLEKWERLYIKSDNIKTLQLKDIRKEICQFNSHDAEKNERAYKVAIELKSEANTTYTPFNPKNEYNKTTIFERLTAYNDIKEIELEYENGEKEYYSVNYNDDGTSEHNNKNQYSYIAPSGNLYITIWKKKNVFDVFKF